MSEPITLIAGFPGVLAQRLLLRLLADDLTGQLLLLVSNDQQEQANATVAALPSEWSRRVAVLEGDAAAIDLGLSGKEYGSLANRVRTIHFIAPSTNPNTGRKRAESSNVGGAREVLELGRNCSQLARLVYYSSALVSGDRTGSILESDLENNQGFRGAVEQSLATAERMVRAEVGKIPITVLRPSLIGCDSKTGEIDGDNPLGLLVFLILNSPQELPVFIPGNGDIAMNLTSVDFVIDVALRVASFPQAIGKTFHVTDPRPPSVRQFFELCAQSAGRKAPSASLPPGLSKALFNAPGPLSWAKTPRALVDLMTTPVHYDSRNTELALLGTGIECPRFESYVELLVNSIKQRRGLFKQAGVQKTT